MKKMVFYALVSLIGLHIMFGYFIAYSASLLGSFSDFLQTSDGGRSFFFNCGVIIFIGGLILFINEGLKK